MIKGRRQFQLKELSWRMSLPLDHTSHYRAPFLPANTILAKKWLEDIHDQNNHTKSAAAVAGLALASAYFFKAVRVLNKIKQDCSKCALARPVSIPMEIAQVPHDRISGVQGLHLAVDTIGPFRTQEKMNQVSTRANRTQVLKTYALVASDTYTRRLHICLLEDLGISCLDAGSLHNIHQFWDPQDPVERCRKQSAGFRQPTADRARGTRRPGK